MKRFQPTLVLFAFVLAFAACKKTAEPLVIILPSEGSKLQLNGIAGSESGSSAANSVYVDLSADKATTVLRTSWDLGFFAGSDFRVIINNTTAATAKVLAKNDLAQVVTADTAGFSKQMVFASYTATSLALIDNVLGDLSKTVIAGVSATDADNKVYIINPETAVNPATGGALSTRGLYKIRILRKGAGYTLQYAKLSETTFKTIDVTKNDDYNFQYVSFDNGAVNVEPVKTQWDFVWSFSMYQTALVPNDPTSMVPQTVSDFIALNAKSNVQVSEVLTATVGSYADFNEAKLTGVTFNAAADAVGTKWRTASPTAGQSGVKTDRFYVVKDAAGNIYKLKFLSFHADEGGTRGKPEFEYKIVKKA